MGPFTSLTSGRSLLYSSNQAVWRAASEGPVEAVGSASSASDSFRTLEGVASSLKLLVASLLPRFLSLWEILTLRPRGGCSSSGVGSSALSELVLEASVTHSWTCWLVFEVLGVDSFLSDTSGSGLPSSG